VVTTAAIATEIVAGINTTCTISGPQVTCWGSNAHGALGDGSAVSDSTLPVMVSNVSGATKLALGNADACALTPSGLWCWGWNSTGQLGNGEMTDTPVATPIAVPLTFVTDVAAGGTHTCALRQDGSIWCWGAGNDGQLGRGDQASSAVPRLVIGPCS